MTNIDNLFNRAIQLHKMGKPLEARVFYAQILEEIPTHVKALNLLGATYLQTGEHQKGLPFIEQALAIKADFLEAYNNLGIALKALKRYEEAVSCYQKALALKPDYALGYYNLGIVLKELKRYEEAVSCYQKALALKPDYAEAHNNLGIALKELKRYEEAATCYQKALAIKPDFADAYRNLGNTLQELKRLEEAVPFYQKALAIKPDYADAYNNLGIVLKELQRHEEALACYRKALALKPDYAEAYNNLGIALQDLGRHEEVAACYKKVLSIKPDYDFALGMYFHSKAHCCDWSDFDETLQELLGGIDAGKVVSTPFSLQAAPSTPAQQKRCAEICVQKKYAVLPSAENINRRYAHDKIRLGYFSADFHDHPVGKLTAELFEQHDRSKFEVFGFSYGATKTDSMRQRIITAFDHFIDIRNQPDQEIATLARHLEIDVAIDLTGHTSNSRIGIFARHLAPIQVKFLGDPGTTGAPYIDYLIADPTVIPVEHQQHYSEKIAYLPNSYLVNGSHRQISERQFTRSEFGLPDEGFIFCGFNVNFKISPIIFNTWIKILKQVEGSVLWLTEGNAQVRHNLRNEARKRGIAPERLVFAKRMDLLSDHLARYQLADLFLDTFIFNAHTTASDSLWAGLPVLTYLGEAFPGRVAASLLNAIGLPELITHSHEEYQALAIELATNPKKLAMIKQQLAKNRGTHPLFNAVLFTRHIEDAFTQMWERHQASLLPDHIYVSEQGIENIPHSEQRQK